MEDIFETFSRMTLSIEPRNETLSTSGHISQLPREVLLRIFADTVKPFGDVHTLGQLAGVCRCFFMLVQDDGLWSLVARRLYTPAPRSLQPYATWRELCFSMPRPLWHGIYVSKLSYVRHGEQVSAHTPCPFCRGRHRGAVPC